MRVHTDAASVALTDSMQARALTVGNRIHFGAGQYRPDSPGGQDLLAHEAVHVAQQSRATRVSPNLVEIRSSERLRLSRERSARPLGSTVASSIDRSGGAAGHDGAAVSRNSQRDRQCSARGSTAAGGPTTVNDAGRRQHRFQRDGHRPQARHRDRCVAGGLVQGETSHRFRRGGRGTEQPHASQRRPSSRKRTSSTRTGGASSRTCSSRASPGSIPTSRSTSGCGSTA